MLSSLKRDISGYFGWFGLILGLGFSSFGVSASTYSEHCVVVTGSAPVSGVSDEFARQMAIRDALKQASMQVNLSVTSEQAVEDFVITHDTTRFTSFSKVRKFKIVDEGVQKLSADDWFAKKLIDQPLSDVEPLVSDELQADLLHDPNIPLSEQVRVASQASDSQKAEIYEVTLAVCLTEDPAACNNVPGNQLNPRLAVAQVVTTDAYGARDIANLLPGYRLELTRRLRQQGFTNFVAIENGTQLQPGLEVTPNLDMALLDPIRDETGAQYLLLTVLRSVKALNERPKVWKRFLDFYHAESSPNARYLEVDYYLVDLMSYQTVDQQRLGFDVKGDVLVGRDRPFGSSSFFATDTGMVFHHLLDQQVIQVREFLNCKPVKSQIIDVRNDEYIIYLSRESGAEVGDELAVYHKVGPNVRFQGVDLGADAKPAGFLKIERIHNKFAVAKVLAKDDLIEIGDWVMTW